MDFWEGEFLGPRWAQTDYEDRRHPAFHFFVGFIALAVGLAMYFVPALQRYLPLPALFYLFTSLVLLIALPFVAARYHGLPRPVKVLVLLAYALMYLSSWCFVLKSFMGDEPGASASGLVMQIGELANNLMANLAGFFSFLGGLSATLAGVAAGAILLALVGIVILVLAIYAPLLYFFLLKKLQRLWDSFILNRFYPDRLNS